MNSEASYRSNFILKAAQPCLDFCGYCLEPNNGVLRGISEFCTKMGLDKDI